MAPTPNASPVPKCEKFSWAEPCPPGAFLMIKKDDLNIDGSYQREEVSRSKVLDIARDWDWKLFGTLSVIMREDGTLWLYDGGHRCRASFLRKEITELPCMVFEAEDEKTEAKAFIGTNTMKSSVSAYHKHRAAVKTGEPIAVAAQSILEQNGYFAKQHASKKFAFAALECLHKQVDKDRLLAEKVFAACASIAEDGETISNKVLGALFFCQKKLEGKADILTNGHLERLKRHTLQGIEVSIERKKHLVGRGGDAVAAEAVLNVLNKGKSKHRLAFD